MIVPWRFLAVFTSATLLAGTHPGQEQTPDPAQQVRALVEQFKGTDSARRRKAEEELLLMGPRALPFLREELAGSDGDLKSRLDSLIGKIERNRRQAAAQGKTLLVRLTAEESLITTLLADIQKSTGVPIENRSPPSYATATVAGDGISLWDAVDRICKTHGQLTWDISQWGIVVRGEPYAPPPMALNSGYAFLFREFVRTSAGRDGKNVGLQSEAYVAGPPGVVTAAAYLTYDALTDDRGTDLLKGPKGTPIDPVTKGFNLLAEPDMRYPLFVHLVDLLAPSPGHAATRVKTCKGVAIVRAVVDLKKTVELRGPALKKGAKASASGLSIRIEEFTLAGGHLKIEMDITDTRGSGKKDRNLPYPQSAGKVVVRDADGRDVALALSPGVGPLPVKGPGGTSANEVARYRVEGTLKADLSVVAIEVWEPSEVEEIKIPFDLKDIPFRRR